jgi:acyl-CoA thioesterase
MEGFSDATAVTRAGETRWTAAVVDGWDIYGNANGGTLLAIATRAMQEASGLPDPLSVTAHFLAPGKVGEVAVDADVVRAGKRFSTVTASMAAGGQRLLQVVGTFTDLDRSGDPAGTEVITASPPDLPTPDLCVRNLPAAGAPEFSARVEQRLHPDDVGFQTGSLSGEAVMRGWFRLDDGAQPDPLVLVQAVDAMPPAAFNLGLPDGWVPTLELTVHVRARPAPGWLATAFRTRFITGGFLEEDGEVWDSSGRLVAQSRQLALVPRAPRPG